MALRWTNHKQIYDLLDTMSILATETNALNRFKVAIKCIII